MVNILSNSNIWSHLKCVECQEVLDFKSDTGISYLAYIVGKGKFKQKYYCLNCLNDLMKKTN